MQIVSFVVAAFGALASASDRTFSLRASPNSDSRVNLLGTYARLYQKYNMTLPQPLSVALHEQYPNNTHPTLFPARRRGEETGATSGRPSSINDGEYFVEVAIGTPPQYFRLNLDTGSSDVWVYGTALPRSLLHEQRQYDADKSSTSKVVPWHIWLAGYIDFSFVGGLVYKDTVTVGETLEVKEQGVQVATLVSSSLVQDAGMDGILGLGFDGLNFAWPTKQKTWFTNIKEKLNLPLFTVDFQHRKESTFTFGYVDQKVGPVTYTPVDTGSGYWTMTSPGYAVGAKPFKQRTLKGTVDTGTTVLLVPADVVKDYYAGVPGLAYSQTEQGYIFDCAATLPDFTFGVGPHASITIPGAYLRLPDEADVGKCVGAMQAGAGDMVVFGAPALKAGVAVFDQGRMQIGWANKTLHL